MRRKRAEKRRPKRFAEAPPKHNEACRYCGKPVTVDHGLCWPCLQTRNRRRACDLPKFPF
jgi:hypothetical protein